MKQTLFLSLILVLIVPFRTLHAQSRKLETCIVQIVNAFHTEDPELINHFIHHDHGLVVLFRRGVMDEYITTDRSKDESHAACGLLRSAKHIR
ncbi:MAG: hypothetical protein JW801_19300 [Bacteroidales bacterium]|nr:hypothetical protein [Bacteroidales bacterium]